MSIQDEQAKRVKELQQIEAEIQDLDGSPLYSFRNENGYLPVIGEGNILADVMIVGEAPGLREAQTGHPFVGQSGMILDKLLESIGLARQDVYITNVVKDRPPENRKPTKQEIALYAPYLIRQIEIIHPSVIVALGQVAMETLFHKFGLAERSQKLSQLHGKVFEARSAYGQVHIVPLFHPAVTFYNREYKDRLETDIHVLEPLI